MKVIHAAHGGGGHRFDYDAQGIEVVIPKGSIEEGDIRIVITQEAQDSHYSLPHVRMYSDGEINVDVEQEAWDEHKWYPPHLYPGNPAA